jgi:glyceraldehyde-3-phosphate dehydrogenase/erythrose-4-phosphate dehydrogenase
MEMKMAYEHEQDEEKKVHTRMRSKRNIFGSIISSFTGLATGVRAPHKKNPQ